MISPPLNIPLNHFIREEKILFSRYLTSIKKSFLINLKTLKQNWSQIFVSSLLLKDNSESFTWYEYFIEWETNYSRAEILQTSNWPDTQGHNVTGWLIKWKSGSCLTFTRINYYCGYFQTAGNWVKVSILEDDLSFFSDYQRHL